MSINLKKLTMKKIIFSIVFCSLAALANGQVAIGKESINGNSTLLDFYDEPDNFRGIILPAVESAPTLAGANNGTFVFDKTEQKIRMFEAGDWKDLSGEGDASDVLANTSNETGDGVIIGAETTSAEGVLVLESPDKAMILPKIANPHITVKSPFPGMICYDTVSKSLAVFDGSVWNYWK